MHYAANENKKAFRRITLSATAEKNIIWLEKVNKKLEREHKEFGTGSLLVLLPFLLILISLTHPGGKFSATVFLMSIYNVYNKSYSFFDIVNTCRKKNVKIYTQLCRLL